MVQIPHEIENSHNTIEVFLELGLALSNGSGDEEKIMGVVEHIFL